MSDGPGLRQAALAAAFALALVSHTVAARAQVTPVGVTTPASCAALTDAVELADDSDAQALDLALQRLAPCLVTDATESVSAAQRARVRLAAARLVHLRYVSRWPQALPEITLERAAQLAREAESLASNGPTLRLHAILRQALVAFENWQPEATAILAERARALAQSLPALAPEDALAFWLVQVRASLLNGRGTQAATQLREAQRAADGVTSLSNALRYELALLHGQTATVSGGPRQALEHFDTAALLLNAMPGASPRRSAQLSIARAQAQQLAGRDDEARATLESTARLTRDTLGEEHPYLIYVYASLASVYRNLGKHAESLALLDRTLPPLLARRGDDHPLASRIQAELGWSMVLAGRAAEALAPLQAASRAADARVGAASFHANWTRHLLGFALLRAGETSQAKDVLDEVVQRYTASIGVDHPLTLRARQLAAYARGQLGETGAAIIALEQILAAYRAQLGDGHVFVLETLADLSHMRERANDKQGALADLRALVAALEQSRETGSLSIDDRRSAFLPWVPYYRRLMLRRFEAGDTPGAFETAELAKARALLEALAARRARDSALLSDAERKRFAELEQRAAELDNTLADFNVSATARLALETEKNDVLRAHAALRREAAAANPKFAALTRPALVDARLANLTLDKQSVIVSYASYGSRYLAFVIDGQRRVRAHDLGELPHLASAVEALRVLLQPAHDAPPWVWQTQPDRFVVQLVRPQADALQVRDANTVARAIGAQVLAPLAPLLREAKHVIISADGPLTLVPFELLTLNDEPLIARHEVSYTQSVSAWAAGVRTARDPAQERIEGVLSIGAPNGVSNHTQVALGATLRAVPADDTTWPALPGARREIDHVQALFKPSAMALTDTRATKRAVRELSDNATLRRYRYVHFASHGVLDTVVPRRSALILGADPGSATATTRLTAAELPALDFASDLGVFSACSTGEGKLEAGEGVLGLPYALGIAGNRQTILTLAAVDDASSDVFVTALFKHLKAGAAPRNALAQVKRDFLRDARLRDPCHWAPFVLYGGP